jgi:beta-glucosidase
MPALRSPTSTVRRKTRRRLSSALTAVVQATLLAACGGGSTDGTSTNSPSINASDPDTAADTRARALLAQMTQDEKIQLVHGTGVGQGPIGGSGYIPGIARLGIPDYIAADSTTGVLQARVGATGVSLEVNLSTPMPAPIAVAATWNPERAHDVGAQIAKELRALGFSEGLGGAVNLAREPRSGRTFENLGEDPVLAGQMIAARTQGTQSEHVVATIKHFAGNEQETNRTESNSVIDERTLRELYLLPFEIGIQEGKPGNVMCAYNLLNGLKSCENPYLLTDVLKTEWGFQGKVQSDWFAGLTDTVRGATAGLDEEQAGSTDDSVGFFGRPSYFNQRLKAALQAGSVAQARLDDMVLRKLRVMARHGLLDNPARPGGTIDTAAGDAVARRVAQEAMVLLKNATPGGASSAALPLAAGSVQRIVVIGGHADVAVLSGGGSAGATPRDGNPVACLRPGYTVGYVDGCAIWYRSSPLDALRAKAPNAVITYYDGSDAAAAAAAAANADVAVVFGTQWQTEGGDLASLGLPDGTADPANQSYDQNALISAVAAQARKTVVVLQSGTAVTMPWLPQVHAVLQAWYPGVQGGPAIADILFGDVNPSGKLPLTFPLAETDLPQPVISATDLHVPYSEGLAMGYRWYDSRSITPLFPFGHGLSYTTFTYSGMKTSAQPDGSVNVSFTLTNTGHRDGAEVAQVYAGLPTNLGQPPRRLVAWQKVSLSAGQSVNLNVTVPPKRLSIWDTAQHGWRVPAGSYTFHVGGSSRELLTQVLRQSLSGRPL